MNKSTNQLNNASIISAIAILAAAVLRFSPALNSNEQKKSVVISIELLSSIITLGFMLVASYPRQNEKQQTEQLKIINNLIDEQHEKKQMLFHKIVRGVEDSKSKLENENSKLQTDNSKKDKLASLQREYIGHLTNYSKGKNKAISKIAKSILNLEGKINDKQLIEEKNKLSKQDKALKETQKTLKKEKEDLANLNLKRYLLSHIKNKKQQLLETIEEQGPNAYNYLKQVAGTDENAYKFQIPGNDDNYKEHQATADSLEKRIYEIATSKNEFKDNDFLKIEKQKFDLTLKKVELDTAKLAAENEKVKAEITAWKGTKHDINEKLSILKASLGDEKQEIFERILNDISKNTPKSTAEDKNVAVGITKEKPRRMFFSGEKRKESKLPSPSADNKQETKENPLEKVITINNPTQSKP